jgi:hypothetical protein
MAMACLGLVTFLPLRPDFNLPCFISRISRSTFLPADGEYFRVEDFFFEVDFLELVFVEDDALVLLRALPLRERELLEPLVRELFRELVDFFRVAFLVAITILLERQMRSSLRQVACGDLGKTT